MTTITDSQFAAINTRLRALELIAEKSAKRTKLAKTFFGYLGLIVFISSLAYLFLS